MNRKSFLKRIGIGIPAVIMTPTILESVVPREIKPEPQEHVVTDPVGKKWKVKVHSCGTGCSISAE